MMHDGPLAVLSFAVALFASYTALDMGSRLRLAQGKARKLWLLGSAVVLGGGIWSMHFVAMLAFKPGFPVVYDFDLTALSLLIAVVFVAMGFQIVTRPDPSIRRQMSAGAIVGLGVAAMHYSGMEALILPGRIVYDPVLVGVSVVVAMVAATAALWLTLNLTNGWQRAAAAVVMAFAVCGMHYTAMAATSFVCSIVKAAAGISSSGTMLAMAVSMAQFLILCLAMVCVFVDRRFELLAEREAESLRAANQVLTETKDAIRNLLDNSDQGFLTVEADLLVGGQCSAACTAILGEAPEGKPIVELLYRGGAPETLAQARTTLKSLFGEENEFVRDLKIGLLPEKLTLDGKTIRAAYKYLAAKGQLMLILTDVTETALLTEAVERERQRLQMIVLAFTEGDAFSALVRDYQKFLGEELPLLIRLIGASGMQNDLKRRLHTFKGLLAQFSFPDSPQQLHAVETTLASRQCWTPQTAREILIPENLAGSLRHDLDKVNQALGDDFMSSGRRVTLPQWRLDALRQAAETLLARAGTAELRDLLQSVAELGNLDVKAALLLHSRGMVALAERLEKQLAPVTVEGDQASLPPEQYGEFFRSLVHVFRNAVDHGIELPEERLEAGKPEAGKIRCAIARRPDGLDIVIADDGRGIDRAILERKLLAAGRTPAQVTALSLADLVFCEGLSSRDSASQVSGRGIGLAAVGVELDRLDGSVTVESEAGAGTRFHFFLPEGRAPIPMPREEVDAA